MPGKGTTPTQMRLSESDLAKLDAIKEWYGLPSRAAAVRIAVTSLHSAGPPAPRGKIPKKSGEGD